MSGERKYLVLACILVLIPSVRAGAQSRFGVGASYGLANAASASLFYQHEVHQFHLGGTMQFGDERGKPLDDPSGHGATLEGSGTYFWSVGAGYAYTLRDHFPLRVVLSAGKRIHYTNYLDSGFSDGGFHTIDGWDLALGVGVDIGYDVMDLFEVYAGFHSLWYLYFGVRVPIPGFL